jgi:hypothetical protein
MNKENNKKLVMKVSGVGGRAIAEAVSRWLSAAAARV